MSADVEQAAADYYEALEEYQSCETFLPPGDPELEEAKYRLEQAEWKYDQALEAQEAEQNVCKEPDPWETESTSTNQSSEFGDGVCEAPEEPYPWETESSNQSSEFGDGVCEAPEEPYPWEEDWNDGQSTCDPYMQSCEEDDQLVCEGEDFFNAFVPCGPESTIVIPETSTLVFAVFTKGGAPISGAKVEVREQFSETSLIEKQTNADGFCHIKVIEEGSYEYLVTKKGYGPETGGPSEPVIGFVEVPPNSTVQVEVNPLTAGPLEIMTLDESGNEISVAEFYAGQFISLKAKLPVSIDGEFFWSTESAGIALENETSQTVKAIALEPSIENGCEAIDLWYRPSGEDAFPIESIELRILASPLSVVISDSTGVVISKGLVVVNDTVTFSGKRPSGIAGTLEWSTSSSNLSFPGGTAGTSQTYNGDSIDVKGEMPSSYLGSDQISLTFTPYDGAPVIETIPVTVVSGDFEQSPANNSYGFDEMSGVANDLPHVSVAKGNRTCVMLHLDTNGLKLEKDFVLTVEDDSICMLGTTNELSTTDFDVKILADDEDATAETKIHARLHRNDGPVIACVVVNRYKPLNFTVEWGAFQDTTCKMVMKTTTNDLQKSINGWASQICAKFSMKYLINAPNPDKPVDVNFDLNKDGELDYPYSGKSNEQRAIEPLFALAHKVIIIQKMGTVFELASAVNRKDTQFELKDTAEFFLAGRYVLKGKDLTGKFKTETIEILDPLNSNLKLIRLDTTKKKMKNGLSRSYAAGAKLVFPAAGWSGNPIYIESRTLSKIDLAQTILHELSHEYLDLLDVESPTNIMNSYVSGGTRFRFLKLPLTYPQSGGVTDECQWKKPTR